jgi:hypothetical protein
VKISREKLERKTMIRPFSAGLLTHGVEVSALGHTYQIELCDTSVAKFVRALDVAMETIHARIEQSVGEIADTPEGR